MIADETTADDTVLKSIPEASPSMSTLSPRFEDGLVFAAQLHARQKRKGTEIPYVAHLLAVAGLALEYGANEDEAIAALLHDAIEDQGGVETENLILQKFGPSVAFVVRGCTDADTIPKPPWSVRKQIYISHLAEAPASVRLVSCCDKIHNARAILRDYEALGEALWDRFKGGKGGTLWYYGELANAFLRFGPAAPSDELNKIVVALETRAGVSRGEARIPEGL